MSCSNGPKGQGKCEENDASTKPLEKFQENCNHPSIQSLLSSHQIRDELVRSPLSGNIRPENGSDSDCDSQMNDEVNDKGAVKEKISK